MLASSILRVGSTITRTRKEGVDEGLPDAKQQKLEGSEGEFRNSVANLLDFVKKEVQAPKAPGIITVLDSSDAEAENYGRISRFAADAEKTMMPMSTPMNTRSNATPTQVLLRFAYM